MLRKIVWALLLLLVALAGGTVWFFQTYHSFNDYLALSQIKKVEAPPTVVTQGVDKIVCTDYMSVTNITPQSITINKSGAPTYNFALTGKTRVFSLALVGQPAKTVKDIKVGATVRICPSKSERMAAGWIIFQRDPSVLQIDSEVHTVVGKITALSDSSVTITPTNTASSSVTITLDPMPKIVTTVSNGQTGRNMAVGELVAASSVLTLGGKTTAAMILLPLAVSQ